MPAQRMACRHLRMVEVMGVALHAQALHHGLRTQVGQRGERDDGLPMQRAEAVLQRRPRAFAGQALAPERPGEPPADFHAGRERQRRGGSVQPDEAHELATGKVLCRPEAPAAFLDQCLDPVCHGIALFTAEQCRKVLHDLWVGIQRGKGLPVAGLPLAQYQARCPQGRYRGMCGGHGWRGRCSTSRYAAAWPWKEWGMKPASPASFSTLVRRWKCGSKTSSATASRPPGRRL